MLPGTQSSSQKTTVSAAVRVSPTPAGMIPPRKTSVFPSWNFLTASWRSFRVVRPFDFHQRDLRCFQAFLQLVDDLEMVGEQDHPFSFAHEGGHLLDHGWDFGQRR